MPFLTRSQLLLSLICALMCPSIAAQLTVVPNSGAPSTTPVPEQKDSYGRDTPQSAILNFMRYAQKDNYASASKYLQFSSASQEREGEVYARRLLVLMNSSFRGSVASLSNLPGGNPNDPDNPKVEVAGRFVVQEKEVPLLLVRIFPKNESPIWLVSQQTLAEVPDLYQSVGSPRLAPYFPEFLMRNTLFGVPIGQWLAWLLTILVSWLFGSLVIAAGPWLRRRFRRPLIDQPQPKPLAAPLALVLAIFVNGVLMYLIGMPIFYRVYYYRTLAIVLTFAVAWLMARIADRVYSYERRWSFSRRSQSFLQLIRGISKALIFVGAGLIVLKFVGFDTKTMVAGLGIGGIALAFAARTTLENLFGGITLVMDETVSVGDDCVISGRVVNVQDIGLRSVRVITREGTEIEFPNGILLQTSIENLSRRTKSLILTTLSMSYECSLAQLQCLIAQVRQLLYSHPRVEPETARFRMSGLNSTGYQIELFAYVRTSDGAEFAAIQEDILFRILDLVESIGAEWGTPTHVSYISRQPAIDEKKMSDAARTVSRWQASNEVPFPDFSAQHIAELRNTLAYPRENSVLQQRPVPIKNKTQEAV